MAATRNGGASGHARLYADLCTIVGALGFLAQVALRATSGLSGDPTLVAASVALMLGTPLQRLGELLRERP